ncbi:Protein of unknown function [Gryllus bimaculatus]|nr:Protein of unknown function [Gryllus bimaculatus]
MLLCRIVGYRPFLYATVRDDQRDERQRSVTNWNSEEPKFEETTLLMNRNDVTDEILPQLVRRQHITVDKQKTIQRRKFVSHGQGNHLTQDVLFFSQEADGREEKTYPRRVRHPSMLPQQIKIYANTKNGL